MGNNYLKLTGHYFPINLGVCRKYSTFSSLNSTVQLLLCPTPSPNPAGKEKGCADNALFLSPSMK